jgi:hypothetical protein
MEWSELYNVKWYIQKVFYMLKKAFGSPFLPVYLAQVQALLLLALFICTFTPFKSFSLP